MHGKDRLRMIALTWLLGVAALFTQAWPAAAPVHRAAPPPLLQLGPGDEISLRVFGQPNMNGTMYVSDHGRIQVPLAGPVSVVGLSPAAAARRVEAALQKGRYLVDPHVTITIVKSRSQQVSVLGQVRTPGIYTIASNSTVLDLLAQAGGTTHDGSNTIYILRTGPHGKLHRLKVDLSALAQPGAPPAAATITLRGGDQIYVPRAPVFYVTGEVQKPGRYRLIAGMSVLRAISRAGGINAMGSTHRIVIKRKEPNGHIKVLSARLAAKVQPNDVINVRERIF